MIKTKLTDRSRSDHREIFFGPAIVEYGWEFAKFQTAVRAYCEDHPEPYKIIMSTPGHWPMYELCDEFWDLPEYLLSELGNNGVYRETARIFFRNADDITKRRVKAKEQRLYDDIRSKVNGPIKDAINMCLKYGKGSGKKLQVNVPEYIPDKPYFCISYRHRTLNGWGNWELDKWYKLVSLFQNYTGIDTYKVLGTPEEIKRFGGSPPERKDHNLIRSIALLNNCEFSITPESGSGFLSTACGAPTITFGHEKLRHRHKKRLNQVGTPICYIGSPNRSFKPETILEESKGFL